MPIIRPERPTLATEFVKRVNVPQVAQLLRRVELDAGWRARTKRKDARTAREALIGAPVSIADPEYVEVTLAEPAARRLRKARAEAKAHDRNGREFDPSEIRGGRIDY